MHILVLLYELIIQQGLSIGEAKSMSLLATHVVQLTRLMPNRQFNFTLKAETM